MNTNCIEYEFTQEDYVSHIQYELQKNKPRGSWLNLIFLSFLGSIILSSPLMFLRNGILISLFLWPAFMGVCILLGILYSKRKWRWQAIRIARRKIHQGEIPKQYFGFHRLQLLDDSMKIQYTTLETRRYYAGIQKVEEYVGGILIYNSQLSVDILPASAFGDYDQKAMFLNTLRSKIAQAQNVGVSRQSVEDQKQNAEYTLEYAWDEPSYIAAMVKASRLIYTTRMGWSVGGILSRMIGLLFSLGAVWNACRFVTGASGSAVSPVSFLVCLMFGAVFLLPLLMSLTPWAKRILRQRIDNGIISRDYFGSQALCLKNDRMTEVRRLCCSDVMYESIHCVRQDADNVYLLLKGRRILAIPNSAFISSKHRQEIASYIENKILSRE
ncbi:MAG: hypothetical protein LBB49_03495 [Gracilibacteraceae bacterium]|jgi:hypothetical protein|nr:hypothetical protein [Gracilibacteraceae bacterium]